MNIHFLPDSIYSQQFIDFLSIQDLAKKNEFYIISNDNLKYVSSNVNVISGSHFSILKQLYEVVRNNLNTQLFVHYLSELHLFPLLFARRSIKKYWIYWGADLYSYIDYQLYDSETLRFLGGSNKKRRTIKGIYLYLLRKIVIAKLDYIAMNESEYPILTKNFKTKAEQINLPYSIEERMFEEPVNNTKDDVLTILLGNSGDPTNNHLFILEKLSQMKRPFRVIVPLSYGSNKIYIEKVVEVGKKLLADKFIPILDFMPPDEYIKLLSTVDVAIMNHYRQQAVGNIRLLLNLGKTIYLRPENPLFYFYKEKGVIFKNIVEMNEDNLFSKITEENKAVNLKIVKELYSNNSVLESWGKYL